MIELLVVIAIIGIMAMIAIPNLSSFIAGRKIKDQTSAFARSINLARSEAIKRGRPVSMCRSDAPEAVSPACNGNGGNWATGWLVFVDNNSNSTIDADDKVIRVQPGWTNSGQITTSAPGNNLRFRSIGIGTGLAQTFTFTPKVEGSTKPASIVLSMTGRWRQE